MIISLLTTVFTNINYNNYIEENNRVILNTIALFTENEDVDKTDVMKAITEKGYINKDVLNEFGYNYDTDFFVEYNKVNLALNIIINLIIANCCVIIAMIAMYIFLNKRDKKVDELILYLQNLQNKKYSLQIDNNSEGELSKLENEIYKMAIMLKEQAENSVQDKVNIKDNLVNISHQLKTPLTSMSIMAENMLDFPNMDEETRRKFLENISDRVNHTEFLVQNILKLSKFDANVIEFKDEKINMSNLIETSICKNKVQIEQKNIKVNVNCKENMFFVGDFVWQSEAVSNIIKNAVEHSFEQGKIEINCTENNFFTKISIKDYGKGIKKENIKKIFTRFYKDENSNKNSLGVGLNLSKMIIERNQGNINVISKENEYTNFEITYFKPQ